MSAAGPLVSNAVPRLTANDARQSSSPRRPLAPASTNAVLISVLCIEVQAFLAEPVGHVARGRVGSNSWNWMLDSVERSLSVSELRNQIESINRDSSAMILARLGQMKPD